MALGDREFLRLELELTSLNLLTLLQKGTVLAGIAWVALRAPGHIEWLGLAALGSMVLASGAARGLALRKIAALRAVEVSPGPMPHRSPREVVGAWGRIAREFSLANHFCGVILVWVPTMDLFFLGMARPSSPETALYALGLKVANFSLALPQALAIVFMVWLGRGDAASRGGRERSILIRCTLALAAFAILQMAVFGHFSPEIVRYLSAGRVEPTAQVELVRWIRWLLVGALPFAVVQPVSLWVFLRASQQAALRWVFLPWGVIGVAIYAMAAFRGGPLVLAQANLAVALAYVFLLLGFLRRFRSTP
jgi:hypothetical protein